MRPRHLLILGGTGEAAALAGAAVARFGHGLRVTTSLAGRTARPAPLPGAVRTGGFGGADGMAAYLAAARVDCVIDATHPFAAQISAAARRACELAAVPRLVLLRPPWRPGPGDRWIEVADPDAAAAMVGRVGRRALLTVGARVAAFAAVPGVHFVVRLIEPPGAPLPLPDCEIVIGRGPFAVAGERRLLERHRIDVIVAKASGGAMTEAKLVAARALGLPVILLQRPPPEPGPAVSSIAAALDWLAGTPLPAAMRSMP